MDPSLMIWFYCSRLEEDIFIHKTAADALSAAKHSGGGNYEKYVLLHKCVP